jgi:endonuclease YncB( thermonuclease family)
VCGVGIAIGALGAGPACAQRVEACIVVGADDAATFHLACGSGPRTLKLASVRAPRPGTLPEGGEPYGTQARDLVRAWFTGRRVEVDGRTARVGGDDLRRGLLFLGLVEWAGADATPGAAALRRAEREARLASRGLWSLEAWRVHQASARQPLLLPGAPPTVPREPLGSVAARLERPSAAQRLAAFEAALAQLEAQRTAAPGKVGEAETTAPARVGARRRRRPE